MSNNSHKICVELKDKHIKIINNALDCNISIDNDVELSDAIIELIEQVGEII